MSEARAVGERRIERLRGFPVGFRCIKGLLLAALQKEEGQSSRCILLLLLLRANPERLAVFFTSGVSPLTQPYPIRRNLEEVGTLHASSSSQTGQLFDDAGKLHLGQLLRCRYFSRVWIIQELLLARRVVIPFGDIEVSLEPPSLQALLKENGSSGYKWEETEAPWLQHATQGQFTEFDILQLLRLTASSRSGDPRDKIFGLLGLLRVGRGTLYPDYRLSLGHVLAGISSHCILAARSLNILYSAAGATAGRDYPSWMPLWTQLWGLSTTSVGHERCLASLGHTPDTVNSLLARSLFCNVLDGPRVHGMKPLSGGYSCDNGMPPVSLGPLVRQLIPWHDGTTIGASTGALTINLTHLSRIPAELEHYKVVGKATVYRVRGASNYFMHVVSRNPGLAALIQPLDCVFKLDPDIPGAQLIYLILRCHH